MGDYNRKGYVVDTFHPSVNVVFTTRNSRDCLVYDAQKKNRVSFPLANAIQGSDVMKVAYLRVSRVVLPVSWLNVTADSYFKFTYTSTPYGTKTFLAYPKEAAAYPNEPSTGQLSIQALVQLINSTDDRWILYDTADGSEAAETNLPFDVEYETDVATANKVACARVLFKRAAAQKGGDWDDPTATTHTITIVNSKSEGTLPPHYLADYLGLKPDDASIICGRVAGEDTAARAPAVADVRPYKLLRVQTNTLAQNTPVTSNLLPNPLETIPVESDFGNTIIFEPQQPFHMQIPQLILTGLELQILDEYGNDVDLNYADWSINFIIDFVNRDSQPPPGGLVNPRDRSTNPLDYYNKRLMAYGEGDVVEAGPQSKRRTLTAASAQW